MKRSSSARRIAFLGDYVPRRCGIATFTHNLCESIAELRPAVDCFVVAVNDKPEGYDYPPRVRLQIQQQDLDSYLSAAEKLNELKVGIVCVQHEFGIYGGPAGNYLLAFLNELRMPIVSTLHTVLQEPDTLQRRVMEGLIQHSSRLVVMAEKGAQILRETYRVPSEKIEVIAHGIPDVPFASPEMFKKQFGAQGKSVLLTFGLLGPGKGIEYAIRAMPEIVRQHPLTVYLILGATHPHCIARDGEKYRTSLELLAQNLHVAEHVIFYNRYVSTEGLLQFIGAADIYLTPYLGEAQITSGALAYAFGSGRVAVSTPYWHAKELLADERGVLVPFRDSEAIAAAVCGLLENPERMEQLRRQAYETSRSSVWSAVAKRYLEAFGQAKTSHIPPPVHPSPAWISATRPGKLPPSNLAHIALMTDGTGLLQHAFQNVPNYHEGYCVDDNARAFILCNLLADSHSRHHGPAPDSLAPRYLAFLAAAFNPTTCRFRNFMNHERRWLDEAGSQDSHGRAVWAMGIGANRSKNEGHKRLSARLFTQAFHVVSQFTSPRAWASTLLGIEEFLCAFPNHLEAKSIREILIRKLLECWNEASSEDWPWFETRLTYDNARLSQALILCGHSVPHPQALEIGLKSLTWLVTIQKNPAGLFRPIGNHGFYEKGGARAEFDQQPIEAQAMVAACLAAHQATGETFWWHEARLAFDWFLGRNDLDLPLCDPTGACFDALKNNGVNENQGAESTLAYQIALAEMTAAQGNE